MFILATLLLLPKLSYGGSISINTRPDPSAKCFTIGQSLNHWCVYDSEPFKIGEMDDSILMMENDEMVSLSECQYDAEWNLKRTQTRENKLSKSYKFNDKLKGPDVYIVDTILDENHVQFEGRAKMVFSNQPQGSRNSHGTHVAGTIGSRTYGAAKSARLYGVEVLDSNGSGSWSKIIEGLSFVSKHSKSSAIVNLSLSGRSSRVINEAVKSLKDQGLIVVVAAGNDGMDACLSSPAMADSVITVGSISNEDKQSGFSNYGKCVDILAPGENILSTAFGGGVMYMSGTSMAAPLVSGIIANYVAEANCGNPEHVKEHLLNYATWDKLKDLRGSPNALVFNEYVDDKQCSNSNDKSLLTNLFSYLYIFRYTYSLIKQ